MFPCSRKWSARDHSFHMVGIIGREIAATSGRDISGGFLRRCSAPLSAELAGCIDLMSLPGSSCAGLGGDIDWIDTADPALWQGIWTCKQCGRLAAGFIQPEADAVRVLP